MLLAAISLAACEKAPPPPKEPVGLVLTAVGFDDLPGWDQDPVGAALPALKRSCTRLLARPDANSVAPVETGGTVADWRRACAVLTAVPEGADAELRRVLNAEFTPLQASRSDGKPGLFEKPLEELGRSIRCAHPPGPGRR